MLHHIGGAYLYLVTDQVHEGKRRGPALILSESTFVPLESLVLGAGVSSLGINLGSKAFRERLDLSI